MFDLNNKDTWVVVLLRGDNNIVCNEDSGFVEIQVCSLHRLALDAL